MRLRGEESGGRAARPHAEVFLILVNIIFVQHTISDKNSEIPKKKVLIKKIIKTLKKKESKLTLIIWINGYVWILGPLESKSCVENTKVVD